MPKDEISSKTADEVMKAIDGLDNGEKIKLLDSLYDKFFDKGIPTRGELKKWLEETEDE